ncbi:MAG: hypothetical protein LC772_08385 [Chloroflexi bacterium]|nr:hypothetical protein [Chloroflexota bacterium]
MLNRRAAEILRLNSEEVLGRDLRVLPAPLGDYLYAALRTGTVGRYPNLDLAGSGVPVDASTYPLMLEPSREPVGSVLVVEDITERRALEESRRYADRQEIFNRLISQLAHEIKNPLVAVKTFADLFSADLFSGALNDAEFVAFIRQTVVPEIARLDEVVGKLVDFVNHNSLDLRACDVSVILGDVLQRMTPDSEAAHIVLALSVEDNLPGVRADPSLLSKALSYLLGFLIFNLPRSEKSKVQITAAREVGLAEQIVVDFSSNRAWINAEEIDRLFDPLFVRKDQLNLGLPVARKIVQEHRGDVHALIGADESVVLRVTLPASDAPNR